MALCPKCRGQMGQTAAACGHCGFDFPPPDQRPWWLSQSSLRGWLTVISVLGIPLAFFHYVNPAAHPEFAAFGLAGCSLLCARLLRDSSVWATLFETIALASLL